MYSTNNVIQTPVFTLTEHTRFRRFALSMLDNIARSQLKLVLTPLLCNQSFPFLINSGMNVPNHVFAVVEMKNSDIFDSEQLPLTENRREYQQGKNHFLCFFKSVILSIAVFFKFWARDSCFGCEPFFEGRTQQ